MVLHAVDITSAFADCCERLAQGLGQFLNLPNGPLACAAVDTINLVEDALNVEIVKPGCRTRL